MIPTRYLYQLAEDEGIAIEWQDLYYIQGMYIYTPGVAKPVIVLAKKLATCERELRCILAHELGHHYRTAGNYFVAASRTDFVYATKPERLATKWAVDLLIPTNIFLHCLHRGMTVSELADRFFVIPGFIRFKSELIGQKSYSLP
ncbi:ImmA/IrrE family metallo-endopeptidase [Candidatus Darwinibacter acetoxidans]|nr:hypothetical protein [Bacillota bacterium]